ncbi:MAG: trehalose-6-phosphate synthase [Sandaracinaceae bacterium]
MRTIMVSNRGPLRREDGRWVRSSGGLVTALDPILRERGGVWVSSDPSHGSEELGYSVSGIELPRELSDRYYLDLSNAVLWPILHGFPATIRLGGAPWEAYVEVNERFAARIEQEARGPDPQIWIHDYHLMLAPRLVRQRVPGARIGWFCHVPWPDDDHFRILPWSRELLLGLLGADHVAFQIDRYAVNFMRCVQSRLGLTVDEASRTIELDGHVCRVLVAPIGVPTRDLEEVAERPAVQDRARRLHERVRGRRIVLGVDRLDYTKGIPERLLAFDRLLRDDPSLRDDTVLVQIMVPSRTAVDAYADLKGEIDRLIGEIGGRHGRTGSAPVHYLYRSVDVEELFAHYLAADVALITPLRDGMNLVAQEYVLARTDGALVLSELAGVADHFEEALQVNPYDIAGTAETLRQALAMPREERRRRMDAMRETVRRLDVSLWARHLLSDLEPPRSPVGLAHA